MTAARSETGLWSRLGGVKCVGWRRGVGVGCADTSLALALALTFLAATLSFRLPAAVGAEGAAGFNALPPRDGRPSSLASLLLSLSLWGRRPPWKWGQGRADEIYCSVRYRFRLPFTVQTSESQARSTSGGTTEFASLAVVLARASKRVSLSSLRSYPILFLSARRFWIDIQQ